MVIVVPFQRPRTRLADMHTASLCSFATQTQESPDLSLGAKHMVPYAAPLSFAQTNISAVTFVLCQNPPFWENVTLSRQSVRLESVARFPQVLAQKTVLSTVRDTASQLWEDVRIFPNRIDVDMLSVATWRHQTHCLCFRSVGARCHSNAP